MTQKNGSGTKIAGIDAVMIYSEDPKQLSEWYAAHLGVATTLNTGDGNYYGDVVDGKAKKTIHIGIYPVPEQNARHKGTVMVNYRVDDLDAVVADLEQRGVEVEALIDESFGKFAYVRDPDGNPIELWSPSSAPD